MVVKVLMNYKGKYLKDYAFKVFFDSLPSRISIDSKEAVRFWTPMDTIVARNWNKDFNYKNVDI